MNHYRNVQDRGRFEPNRPTFRSRSCFILRFVVWVKHKNNEVLLAKVFAYNCTKTQAQVNIDQVPQ
jgi:hypothetical protein